jgi:metal-responsive CopG/Arc/MetJ family transcriptional regulator
MRTLVDIPETDIQQLEQLAGRRKLSRAAVIRDAITTYLAQHSRGQAVSAFGAWKSGKIDALKHQRKLRGEW